MRGALRAGEQRVDRPGRSHGAPVHEPDRARGLHGDPEVGGVGSLGRLVVQVEQLVVSGIEVHTDEVAPSRPLLTRRPVPTRAAADAAVQALVEGRPHAIALGTARVTSSTAVDAR